MMLINIPFKIVSDCQALVYLSTNKTKYPQIVRWNALLSEFNCEIEHRPGQKMAHVDALSRAPVDDANEECDLNEIASMYSIVNEDEEVKLYQYSDPQLEAKCAILNKAESERSAYDKSEVRDYERENGVLYKRGNGKLLYVIPRAMRKALVVRFHDFRSHTGVDRTLHKLREHYYFPGMRTYVKRHVRACLHCMLTKTATGKPAGLLHPIIPGKRPFSTINIDHEGPFVTSGRKNKYILALIDNLTKYVVLRAVRDTSVRHVIRVMDEFVLSFGAPDRIISDRGTCFTSRKFADFCTSHGIELVLNSPRHPQANGQIDRLNRTLLPAVQVCLGHPEGKDSDARLREIQRDLDESPNKSTGESPFRMLYGYTARHDEGVLRQLASQNNTEYRLPKDLQEEVRVRVEEAQRRSKTRYDRGHREVIYNVGDIVYMKNALVATGESNKLQRRFRGPLVIAEVFQGDTYRVVELDSSNSSRRYASTAHASQLKLWKPIGDEGPDNEPETNSADDYEENKETTAMSKPNQESEEDDLTSTTNENARPIVTCNEEREGSSPIRVLSERPQRKRKVPAYLRDFVLGNTLEDELV